MGLFLQTLPAIILTPVDPGEERGGITRVEFTN